MWKTRPSGLLTAKPGTKERAEEFYAAFSTSYHVIPTDIFRHSCYFRFKYILLKDSLRYLETDATSSILVTPTVNTKENE